VKLLIKLIFIVTSVFFCSCVSVWSIRNEIKKEHPEIKEVGIERVTWHGRVYFGVDIIFNDSRRLFLTGVYPHLLANFDINRIGEYTYEAFITNTGRVRTWGGFSSKKIDIRVIAEAMGKPMDTLHDVINMYDEIYDFTASLRDINDEEIQAEKEEMLKIARIPYRWIWFSEMEFEQIETNNIMYIAFKDYWDDSQYEGRELKY
jgi:hypothetical protein